MYLKNILSIWVVIILFFITSTGNVFAFSFLAPPDEKTGAPNEGTCADAGCHTSNALNASGGSLMLTIPETYEPGEVYAIIVNLARAGQSKWGFEMTALDADGARAGTFAADNAANTQLTETNSKQYIQHTTAGTADGTDDAHSWKFEWTAPDADVGPVTFYAAGNAANGDFTPAGDYIYTTQAESIPPVPVVAGVALEIVGDIALSTTDAVAGVSYTLKVTNTGNMMDTVVLEASAEVGIEGSVLGSLSNRSVPLEAGASAEVTLKVSGDLFTAPGDYAIDVTAASGTDSTMTAIVTTTTTIEAPVETPPPIEKPPTPPVVESPPTPWDVNGDGQVNILDLVLVSSEFNQSGESLKGDVNGDGTVNILDLVAVSLHFGEDTSN